MSGTVGENWVAEELVRATGEIGSGGAARVELRTKGLDILVGIAGGIMLEVTLSVSRTEVGLIAMGGLILLGGWPVLFCFF